MLAVTIGEGRRIAVEDRPPPVRAPGEAIVRVHLAGICSTDLELAKGYMGFQGVPGHEFVGTVVEAPEGAEELLNARVVGEINAGCGACARCADGLERHCAQRTVLGILGRPGAFAEYLALPVKNLHRVPAKLSSERALFTEPLAAAFEILTQIEVLPREPVLVLGDGKLGALIARCLLFARAEVTVLGRHDDKLAPLREEGIATVVEPRGERVERRRWGIVVEATGSPEGIARALELVEPRGTIVLKSTCAASKPVNLAPIVIDEVTVVGSRCGPFAPALDALSTGKVRPELAIEARYKLPRAPEAFAHAARPGAKKVIFEIAG